MILDDEMHERFRDLYDACTEFVKAFTEQAANAMEIVAQQTLSAMIWMWFALACCAGDAITAIGLLILKSLVWTTIKPMTFDELEEKRNER